MLFNQSYRIFLPTSLLAGAATVASNATTEARAFIGNVGRTEGVFGQGFSTTSGQLAGFGFATSLARTATVGAQWVRLRDSSDIRDHDTVTAALEFTPSKTERLKIQALSSDNGGAGLWADADWTTGRLRQRAGLFHLNRDVLWAETPIVNDQQGGYWRGDYSTLRSTASFGLDAIRTNVNSDPEFEGSDTLAAYGTFNLRIDRVLSIGGGLTLQDINSRNAIGIDSKSLSGNVFASRLSTWGVSRLDLTGYKNHPQSGPGTASSLPPSARTGSFRNNSRPRPRWPYRARRPMGSIVATRRWLLLRGPQIGTLLWDVSAAWTDVDSEMDPERNWNFAGNLHWPITRNWTAQAQISRNVISLGPTFPGAQPSPFRSAQRVQLGLRYDIDGGIPYASLGLPRGRGGGTVTGFVFFDENGDGTQQATERGAPNVTLYLDGRFPVTTDQMGRFEFPPVGAGSHSLRVLIEGLPLPWALEDDKPRTITVPVRGETSVAIPLTRACVPSRSQS